jgi:hypothetical protein
MVGLDHFRPVGFPISLALLRWTNNPIGRREELYRSLPAGSKRILGDRVKVLPGADVKERLKEQEGAFERALRRRGLTRDLASFSLFVGEALASALQAGDELRSSRDGNGDFRFSVERDAQMVFSAGTVSRSDSATPITVWQEYDRRPNPNAEALKKNIRLGT